MSQAWSQGGGADIGTLYVVGTPIGNLEDITLRALRVLGEVGLVAAEDTRSARFLLSNHGIQVPITSLFEHNELIKVDEILSELANKDVALISEAGMPGLSDPGYRLIKAALEAGVEVVPVPGPSALTAALVVSGLPTDSFVYLGFLPRKRSGRRKLLTQMRGEGRTLVAFEAPHRLLESLRDIQDILGDRPVVIARELTKLYEEVLRLNVQEAIDHFTQERPRGEITLVIGGASQEEIAWSEDEVKESLRGLLARDVPKSEAAKIVSQQAKWPRRRVYRIALEL